MQKATFIQPGGGAKGRSITKVHYNPGANLQYVRDMLASQKGNIPSREVSEVEEETMFNQIWNADYRDRR